MATFWAAVLAAVSVTAGAAHPIYEVVATGGTATAAVQLLQKLGAEVVAACFVIDLPEIGGRKKIEALGVPVRTLVAFEGH